MSIKASEISELIKARIANFDAGSEARNTGTVVSVTDASCASTVWRTSATAK